MFLIKMRSSNCIPSAMPLYAFPRECIVSLIVIPIQDKIKPGQNLEYLSTWIIAKPAGSNLIMMLQLMS